MKNALKYGTVLIGVYLVVVHGKNAQGLLSSGASGGSKLVRTFQGR